MATPFPGMFFRHVREMPAGRFPLPSHALQYPYGFFQRKRLKKCESLLKNRKSALNYTEYEHLTRVSQELPVDFNTDNLLQKIITPPLVTENDAYLLKFAENEDEILAAQRLRYRVFNCEQNRGLDSAKNDEFDRDEFDEGAAHLIVFDKGNGMPIGTYRAIGQPGNAPDKMYSAREYEVNGIERYLPQIIEVGRSCVDKDYRNGAVVAFLWSGMAAITLRSGCRYLCGCVSLEDACPPVAWAVYQSLRDKGLFFPDVDFKPRQRFSFQRPAQTEIDSILNDRAQLRAAMPPLLKGYITIGAKLLGEPAFDYEFGSIDLPVMVDMWRLPDRYHKHFFPNITFPGD